jgi:hypothetical protein
VRPRQQDQRLLDPAKLAAARRPARHGAEVGGEAEQGGSRRAGALRSESGHRVAQVGVYGARAAGLAGALLDPLAQLRHCRRTVGREPEHRRLDQHAAPSELRMAHQHVEADQRPEPVSAQGRRRDVERPDERREVVSLLAHGRASVRLRRAALPVGAPVVDDRPQVDLREDLAPDAAIGRDSVHEHGRLAVAALLEGERDAGPLDRGGGHFPTG